MKKLLAAIFFCPEDCLGLVTMHIPVGTVNIAVGVIPAVCGFPLLGAVIAGLFGWGFVTYEIIERRDLHDKGYQEIKGWLFGLAITTIVAGLIYLAVKHYGA